MQAKSRDISQEERKKFGESVVGLRRRLNLTRDQLAQELGLSGNTVKQIELGYQNMGAAARRRFDDLVNQSPETNMVSAKSIACRMSECVTDPKVQLAVHHLMEIGFEEKRAWQIVIEEQLEKK